MVTRRLKRILAGAVLALLAAGPAVADFVCEADVNRTSVPAGGEIVLTVLARGDVGWSPDFQLPEIPGVRIHAGGTNQSMSMVNGATETSVARTYYLKVAEEMNFTIDPVVIKANNSECRTEAIAITVTPRAAADQIPPAQTGNRVAGSAADKAEPSTAGEPGDDIFVKMEVDQEEAWVGQQVILTFQYWRRVQPWNNPSYTPPRTEGFWREDLGERTFRKVLFGRAYNVTEIRYAIFPQSVGPLEIEPAELAFPAGVFDRFFQNRRSRRGPNVLKTDRVIVRVRALPRPTPTGFSGVVASDLKLISQVDRDTVPRGEAVGLKVVLDADGFLKGFQDLNITAPDGGRLHDAGESFRSGGDKDRLLGRITVEKVIVPEREGMLTVPPVELVWFDTTQGLYRTERTGVWNLVVTPSDLPLAGSDESGFLRNEIARLGDDLAFIHQVPGSLSRRQAPWTGSAVWWVGLLLPLVLLAAYRVYLTRLDAERRDPAGRRRRGALAAAEALLAPDQPDASGAVARAICGFVADREDLPQASVGPAEVAAHCMALGLSETGDRLVAILAACDAARFGQADGAASDRMAAEARDLLGALARKRDSGGASAGTAVGLTLLAALLVGLAGPVAMATAQETDPGARPGADPLRLLAEGNQAYTAGDLAVAQQRYQSVLATGVNDAVVHFNLGNTYARSGELGQAVASYLRAQQLSPRDKDITANLAWVRRHIEDLELGQESLPLFIAQFVAVVRALTLDQWGFVLMLCLWVAIGLVARGWWRERFSTRLRRALLGTTAALVVVAAITAARWYGQEVRESAVVIVPEVVVRSGPADNFPALFEVHDGLTLSIVGRREGWIHVGLGGNWQGWIPDASVVPIRRSVSRQVSAAQGR